MSLRNTCARECSSFFIRRCINTIQSRRQKAVQEVRIPIPTGHVAGKWWGSKSCQPILAVHGYLDNAATFDRLVPLLEARSVLCIDLPGHGLSSPPAPGTFPRREDAISVLRYIINHHFRWEKPTLIGHSYGSSLLYSYAALFPEGVQRLISVECGRLWGSYDADNIVDHLKMLQKNVMKSFKEQDPEGLSWEGFISKMMERRKSLGLSMNRSDCEIIARRNTVKISEDKFRLTVDKRFTMGTVPVKPNHATMEEAAWITADVLHLNSSEGIFKKKIDGRLWKKNLEEMKNCKIVNVLAIGGHHVHLENPEEVATAVNDFIRT